MPVGSQRPTRSEGGMHNLYREDHPAYGMIGASRVSSGGRDGGSALFGSDFRHQHYMTIRIHTASLSRSDLSSDYVHADREIIEVAVSEAQWATFVSAVNIGNGVPCTLRYVASEGGYLPQIEPIVDRREQFRGELDGRLAKALDAIAAIRDAAPTKKLREQAEAAIRQLTDGVPWVQKQFDEHTEQTVEKAKVEVEAYLTGAIMRAGLTALGAPERPVLELIEAADPDPDDWTADHAEHGAEFRHPDCPLCAGEA